MMQLRLTISREQDGEWLFKGLPNHPDRRFHDLSKGLAWAERECSAAPAQIEIRIDGFYIFVEQKRGWPRKICGARAIREAEARSGGDPLIATRFGERLRHWLARWRKSIAANAGAYSGSKGEVVLRAASVLFTRRAANRLKSGKDRASSPWA
jgi:hypothetical protein